MVEQALTTLTELSRIEKIFANAAAPAFFLGAVAAFVSLMTTRLGVVNQRIREVRDSASTVNSGPSEGDLTHLKSRARLLHDGIALTLASGICATILLSVLFVSQFFSFDHAYGTGGLFFLATVFLSLGLIRFGQEALHARAELAEH